MTAASLTVAIAHEPASGTIGRRLTRILELCPGETEFIELTSGTRGLLKQLSGVVRRPPRVVWTTQSLRSMSFALMVKLMRPKTRLVIDIGDLNVALFRSTFGHVPARVYGGAALETVCRAVSSGIVTRSEALKARVTTRWTAKTHVIPDCWHGPVAPHSWEANRLVIGVLGTIAWSDSMGWGYGFDLVEVLARLPLHYTGLVIGDGPALPALKERAARLGHGRVEFLGRIAKPDLDDAIARAGIYLLTAPDVPAYASRTTGKLPELVARQHPVLATRVGTAAESLPSDLLIDPWPANSWDTVYDEAAKRIISLASDAWKPYAKSTVTFFDYETYRSVVAGMLS